MSRSMSAKTRPRLDRHDLQDYLAELETRMKEAAANLEFEDAARLRDEIRRLEDCRARYSFRRAKRRRPPAVQAWKPQGGSRDRQAARPPRPRAAPAAAPAPEPRRNPCGDAWLGPRPRAYLRLLDHRLGRLRALLRADELAFVAPAALVGAAAGVAVTVMSRTTQLVHELLFAIPGGAPQRQSGPRLLAGALRSGRRRLPARPVMWLSGRFRSRDAIDPIEANALYGGRSRSPIALGSGWRP